MRLQLAPLTAVRWVIPTVFMAASNSASRELVSPVTIPGSSPRASPSKRPAAAVKCWRSSAGPACEGPATESISGAELADRTAASAWPGSGAASLPVVRSRCPGAAWSQPAPPITSRVACARTRCRVNVHFDQVRRHRPAVREPGTAHRPEPPGRTCYLHFRGDVGLRSDVSGHGAVVPAGRVHGGVAARRRAEEEGHGQGRREVAPGMAREPPGRASGATARPAIPAAPPSASPVTPAALPSAGCAAGLDAGLDTGRTPEQQQSRGGRHQRQAERRQRRGMQVVPRRGRSPHQQCRGDQAHIHSAELFLSGRGGPLQACE